MAIKVLTGKCRAGFVNVFSPQFDERRGKDIYGVRLYIPKDDKATIKKIKDGIEACRKELKNPPKKLTHYPLKDGDDPESFSEKNESLAGTGPNKGHYFINLRTQTQPGIIDKNKNEVIDPKEFVSGDYCRVTMAIFGYDIKGNTGVSVALNNIQVLAKGEPLGSGARAEDDFDNWDDEDAEDEDF